jgi:DnaJ-domain-containing protein 1
MTSPDEYRQFARDCLALAKRARSPSERQILTDMAQLWTQIGARTEGQLASSNDQEKLLAHCPRSWIKREF